MTMYLAKYYYTDGDVYEPHQDNRIEHLFDSENKARKWAIETATAFCKKNLEAANQQWRKSIDDMDTGINDPDEVMDYIEFNVDPDNYEELCFWIETLANLRTEGKAVHIYTDYGERRTWYWEEMVGE